MLPLAGRWEEILRGLLRQLPISDYHKTRLWATSIPRPKGRVQDWTFYRCIELATRAFATEKGYGVAFPGAGNPNSAFSMLEFGVANGQSFQVMLLFRDVWLTGLVVNASRHSTRTFPNGIQKRGPALVIREQRGYPRTRFGAGSAAFGARMRGSPRRCLCRRSPGSVWFRSGIPLECGR
jgi:hypothetical protein